MADDGVRIRRRSLAEEVADRLRRDILTGTFSPGARLVSQVLEDRYGVSHIPIREALRSLEAERLVTSRRGIGAVVAQVGEQDLHDLYDVRKLLEVDVLRRAIPLYDDAILGQAQAALERLTAATPSDDPAWWLDHRNFHSSLLAPGLTPWSERLLESIWHSVERYQRLYVLVFGSLEQANQEHAALLDAAWEGDTDVLVKLWLDHLDDKEASVAKGLKAVRATEAEAS